MDFLWPRTCAVGECHRPADRPGRHICAACFASLPFNDGGGACSICGKTIAERTEHDFICESCRSHPPAFSKACSAVRYSGVVVDLIKAFKFERRALWLRSDFTDLLEGAVRAKLNYSSIDVVVPVPLHRKRLMSRGYNQSGLLAHDLALRLARRFDETSLVRVIDTAHQTRLRADMRKKNLSGAFDVVAPEFIRRRTVLLVDDVMTTGTTLSKCAAALIHAGAADVWCVTVARSVSEGE